MSDSISVDNLTSEARETLRRLYDRLMPTFPMGAVNIGPPEEVTFVDDWTTDEIEDPTDPDSTVFVLVDVDGDPLESVDDACACGATSDGTPYWTLEDDAEDALQEHRQTHEENRYGFPWAHSWAALPCDRVQTSELLAHGFVVIETAEGYRLAGIDGGGYSMMDDHYLPLALAIADRWGAVTCDEDGTIHVDPAKV